MGSDDNAAAPADYELVDHTADWAILVRGKDFSQLLLNAARAMNSLLVAQPEKITPRVERRLRLEAYDREGVLVEWLSELAFLAEMEGLVFSELLLDNVTEHALWATVRGDNSMVLQKHIKAITYHNLVIKETAEGLETTIVLDV